MLELPEPQAQWEQDQKPQQPEGDHDREAGTIRGDFGLDIERNSIHGSDSRKTAEDEIKLFFNEDEIYSLAPV